MKIQQIYTGCIAQAAYYLESNGEAAIFDPLREVQPYIDRANQDNAKIKYIFETHFHADFVSGHLDLAQKTGAEIVYGPTAKPEFTAHIASDNEEFKVGAYTIKALHTPGHTLESTTYLLLDENDQPYGIITGDTLFIGDVGRPDLAQKATEDLTTEKLAGMLFDSLRNRIMPLPDDIIVFPSHGAGSACGKNMSKETTDTLGNQKKNNYALRSDMGKDEFIKELLDGLGAPPAYFPQNVALNSKGYQSLDTVLETGKKALSAQKFKEMADSSDAVVLDVRHESEFVKNHIPGSIFIGLQGQFAPWVGALLMNVDQPILLITAEGKEEEAITRLARVGFDHVLGFLDGGLDAWQEAGFETDHIESISPEEFASADTKPVIDARKPGEFEAEHVEGASNFPLDTVNSEFDKLPEETFYIHCAGGYRSVIMASILKARGIHNLINVEKGMAGIRQTNVPLTKFQCASELK
ncbi:MBL fold metallo-hydrolase [Flavobacterium silvaticum]|uniref:MBL fold metallo-hydrolase n=1 Tax=Flavobacterium silvaticum TaxID=1852020 RepID=A0A972JGI9_9FLAO|nr:MBL fold metallo-hydrolase [Flavobacterium silvaticum]NMH26910.1 MBL fold metallo-hydrolase [Flavobacterium silvaticum]